MLLQSFLDRRAGGVRRGRRRQVLIAGLVLVVVLGGVLFAADRVLFGGPSGPARRRSSR